MSNPAAAATDHPQIPNRGLILDKLRAAAIRLAGKPLSADQVSLIEQNLHQIIPSIRTPTHPAYSYMIYCAITELSEAEGSSQEAISEYIRGNFDDLPWAHERFLGYHLNQLCDSGEIVVSSKGRYSIPGLFPKRKVKRKKKKRGRKRNGVVSNGDGSLGDCGAGNGSVMENKCSFKKDDGRKCSLVGNEEEEKDGKKRAKMEIVKVGRGIDVEGQEGAIVVPRRLEQDDDDDMVQVPSSSEQGLLLPDRGSSLPVNRQIVESADEIVPLVAMDELVEEQLPSLGPFAVEEPSKEVRTEMLELNVEHHGSVDSLAVAPYGCAVGGNAVNSVVDCFIVCGLASYVPERAKHAEKISRKKKKQKLSTLSSRIASHDSAMDIELPGKTLVEHHIQAECSGERKNVWHFVTNKWTGKVRFFQGPKSKPDEAKEGKVLEDSYSGKFAQLDLLPESVPPQELSSEQLEMQAKVTLPVPEPTAAAPAEKTILLHDQNNEQQVKQKKKSKRKRKERPSGSGSATCPMSFSLSLQDEHKLQQESQIPPDAVSKVAPPLKLASPSGDQDIQQQRKERRRGQMKLEPHRDELRRLGVEGEKTCQQGRASELELSGEVHATRSLSIIAQDQLEEGQTDGPIALSSSDAEPKLVGLRSSSQVRQSPKEKPKRKRGRPCKDGTSPKEKQKQNRARPRQDGTSPKEKPKRKRKRGRPRKDGTSQD